MRTDSVLPPPPECSHRGRAASSAERPRTVVRVTHGAHDDFFPVAGKSVASLRKALATAFGIPTDALPMIGGRVVGPDRILGAGDELLFAKERGHKGVGTQVWTGEEFCKFFKITPEDLDAWIGQGLKAKRVLDGSLRITETAADEFFRGRVIESPYLSTDEAAAYCNVSKDAFYGRVERRKIQPLPGSGKENRFTREQCDKMMKGEGR
jgi:hypothetical protein